MGKYCLRPTVENIEVTYTRLMRPDAVIVLTCSLPNFAEKKVCFGITFSLLHEVQLV